ncbi:MAG TPA: PhzF family phenazine biosynthesis protein [Solirubrobacterales bacterium]|nr:PhzF family phenazine biosynthesis protein [Solirubrobacterales bacterium]
MPTLHVLRVFVNEDGEWGNRLGVFLDGTEIAAADRQAVAADLGYSETVFVDNRPAGWLRIHTPEVELPFAGHPTVGAAWLLAETGAPVETLRPPAGEIRGRREGDLAYIVASARFAPEFEYRRLETPAEVGALAGPGADGANLYAWAWIDQAAGTIRARSFVPEEGIAEDEATGSAALALCSLLDRPLVVHQGHGSVIRCRPRAGGKAEVGGRVVLDEVLDYRH